MLSFVGLNDEFSIFSISMLGACFASSIPALGIVLASLIGNFIKFGVGGVLGYFLTALVMLISLFIIKPRYNEQERNEKIKVGKNVFISVLVIQAVKCIMSGFTIYDILSTITLAMIALVFYKIFVNSTVVIQEFYLKRAFSIEEVIGASLLLAIAVGGFGDLSIAGFGIRNILSILIVMILGWKNGILIGTTSGVTIGVTLGVISGTEPIMIAAYAISGMLAGILNKFGKIGVVIGFTLGNVLLAYVSNGYTVELIHFKEILIASLGLLLIPKTLKIDIEEFIGTNKFLPGAPGRALNKSKEMQMVRITTQDGKKVEGLLNVTKDSNGNVKEMYVDIGVDSADEVKALGIDVGDMVCFASEARQIQDKVIAGKAMDDRTGCYVMIEAMKRIHGDVENDIYFVGTSSEEVGVRGGKTATHLIDPDIVFALDVANNPELVKNYTNHRLIGKGPMIVHYDKTLSPNKKLIKYVKELASKHGIPYQSDMFGGGGTDAGNAHLEKGGRLALVLGIPLRYCHGSYSFVHSDDLESLTQLVNCLIDHLTYQDYQNFINFIGG